MKFFFFLLETPNPPCYRNFLSVMMEIICVSAGLAIPLCFILHSHYKTILYLQTIHF